MGFLRATHDIGVYVSNNCNVTVRPVNNCGVSVYVPYVVSFSVMTYGCYSSYCVSPNPAFSTITVLRNTKNSSAQNKTEIFSFTAVDIIDKQGNFKKRLKFGKRTNTATIDISSLPTDNYKVRIFNGTNWEDYKIIVAK